MARAIYTAATRRAAAFVLATTGLGAHFPVVIAGDEVSKPKPAPLGLQLACRHLAVTPTESAYVGDAEVDLGCAEAAGAVGNHARWGAPVAVLPDPGSESRLVALHPCELAGLLLRRSRLS